MQNTIGKLATIFQVNKEKDSLRRTGFWSEELCALIEKHRARILEIAGLEGLSSHHEKETNRFYKDQEKWNMWVEILLETCTHQSVVGSSEHFLIVCRKQC